MTIFMRWRMNFIAGTWSSERSILYSGCKIYNHLPLKIKNTSNNVTLFKPTLKKFLFQHMFYSLDEYYQLKCNDYNS